MTLAGLNSLKFGSTAVLADPLERGKTSPLYLKGATEAKSKEATRREEERSAELSLVSPLTDDTFSKSATAPAGQDQNAAGGGAQGALPVAADVKSVLKDGSFMSRKGNTAFLIKCAAGIDHTQNKLLEGNLPDATKQEELKQTADTVKNLGNEDKVRLMGDVTGGDSVYTRYAKHRLLGESGFALKDNLELFKPQMKDKTLEGIQESFAAVGAGLASLALIGVGGPLFGTTGIAKLVTALGVILA